MIISIFYSTVRRASPERRAPPPPPEKRVASPISFSIEKRPNPVVPNAQGLKRKKAVSPPQNESRRGAAAAKSQATGGGSGGVRRGEKHRSSNSSSSESSNSSGSGSDSSDSASSAGSNRKGKHASARRHDKTALEKKGSSKTGKIWINFRLGESLLILSSCSFKIRVEQHLVEENDPPRRIIETAARGGGCDRPETVQIVVI